MPRENKNLKLIQKKENFPTCVCDKASGKYDRLADLLFLCLFLFHVPS